jgi:hypothetical protein
VTDEEMALAATECGVKPPGSDWTRQLIRTFMAQHESTAVPM